MATSKGLKAYKTILRPLAYDGQKQRIIGRLRKIPRSPKSRPGYCEGESMVSECRRRRRELAARYPGLLGSGRESLLAIEVSLRRGDPLPVTSRMHQR